jgi:hypothetical protein
VLAGVAEIQIDERVIACASPSPPAGRKRPFSILVIGSTITPCLWNRHQKDQMQMQMRKTFRFLTLVAVVTILSTTVVYGQKKKKKSTNQDQSAPSAPATIPDQTVAVDDGRFVFRSLQGVQQYYTQYLSGTVTSETSHAWEYVSFELKWTDTNGGTGTMGMVICGTVPKGGTCSLGSPGMMLYPNTPNNISHAEFHLANGIYVPEYTFKLLKPQDSEQGVFEDTNVLFVGRVLVDGIAIAVLNKSNDPIKIDWNQVSYIDETRKANGVSHVGVKYAEASNTKPPTVIPPGARHEDTVVPVGKIFYSENSGWHVSSILPKGAESRNVVGKTIALFLPMEISGKVQNYNVVFQIVSVN